MSVIYLLFIINIPIQSVASEAVLIPRKSGENIYVKEYEFFDDSIHYTNCQGQEGSKPNRDYTVMEDENSCLAVSSLDQHKFTVKFLKLAEGNPNIEEVRVEYPHSEIASIKEREKSMKQVSRLYLGKFCGFSQSDRFRLIINLSNGIKENDYKKLKDELKAKGFPNIYFKIERKKSANECFKKYE